MTPRRGHYTRRDVLTRASLGLAALLALAAPLRQMVLPRAKQRVDPQEFPEEDSIFHPRPDQRARIRAHWTGRKPPQPT